ncbi:MAG: aspartate carbamoyltransferase catalytic subunit [Ruminococcaceae bacterium]|nr:aspartate carbamoyltransferase catalytic subunit [Oscillospiraceae bacterium]
MKLATKDLLGMKELSAEEIRYILYQAEIMKHILLQDAKKTPHLQGRTVVTLFYENSTRTRLSFELASKYMSANAANITASGSSVQKGESLIDTAKTLDAMATDVIIIRHQMSGAPHLIAKNVNAAVINAGDGMNEHPTQALLDLLTMKEKKGQIEGLRVAIIGDVAHSRVARSNIYALQKLGAEVVVGGPSTLLPRDIATLGVEVYENVESALRGADVVMCLRLQKERQQNGLLPSMREYSKFFGVDEKRLALAKPDALIMHPGPVNRGVELTSGVMSLDRAVINEQVTNGVAVRMAVLNILAKRSGHYGNFN